MRATRLRQKPATLWFTGLSASGKSTLAYALESVLFQQGHACAVLDGDNLRRGLNRDLGFADADRAENVRRVAEVAALMNDAGLIVITALISPCAADRACAKAVIGAHRFLEIYLDTPLCICEARDPKGLYQKARTGGIAQFTGISQKYEAPTHADLRINTHALGVSECVARVMSLLSPLF